MEDLSMFERPRTVALEDENPGTSGMVLFYPLNRLVEYGFVGDTAVNPWVGIFCRRQGFVRESESLMRPRTVALEDENPGTSGMVLFYPLNRLVEESRINLVVTPRAERSSPPPPPLQHGPASVTDQPPPDRHRSPHDDPNYV
ncbi:hypothetical protein PIB30_011120 [Stylosanthes scabra]|uniref:Uncharacterized protein n=1 Tax=Stylosanthes scabra TaxID=79078 RepID=A0ABU6Z3H1_9FABA|nr:hypothetical protein [Stylosanthes scabra]